MCLEILILTGPDKLGTIWTDGHIVIRGPYRMVEISLLAIGLSVERTL